MRKAIAAFGAIGLVGCFLPLMGGISMFDLRHFEALPVWLLLAAFAVPMVAGLADHTRAAAVVGTLGFGYVLFKFGFDTVNLVMDASIGGKLIGAAAIAGFACSLLAFAEKRTRA